MSIVTLGFGYEDIPTGEIGFGSEIHEYEFSVQSSFYTFSGYKSSDITFSVNSTDIEFTSVKVSEFSFSQEVNNLVFDQVKSSLEFNQEVHEYEFIKD